MDSNRSSITSARVCSGLVRSPLSVNLWDRDGPEPALVKLRLSNGSTSLDLDVVRRAGDVVVAPLDKDDVFAPLPHHVVHRVPPAALVLDHHLNE